METDSVTCTQNSESQGERSSAAGKLCFTEDTETTITEDHTDEKKEPQDKNKEEDTEVISGLEKTETPENQFTLEPHDHATSLPEGGATEPTMETVSTNDDQAQEWPPVPGLEEDIQAEENECQATEIQDDVKKNSEASEAVKTAMKDIQGGEPVMTTQVDKSTDSPKIPKVTSEEERQELESHGDSDSIVFLSENSEELNIDCKSVDFATTREQWVRRDSRDEVQNVPYSKSSSITETESSSRAQSESKTESGVTAENVQQRELEANNSYCLTENEVMQQVCDEAPPLETFPDRPTNREQENSGCVSMEVKEPLIIPERRRDSESQEREASETGEERKQTQTGGTGGKQLLEVKDQRQERENKGQSAESQSNTKPHQGEGKAKRMQVDHFDDSQSDSGVSADFSPNSTTDEAPQPSESPPYETPIDREIRLALKREQSLRRSRGLCDTTDMTNEFVEIPLRKPILSQDLQIRPSQTLDKDRQFAGKKMQKEISAETEREKVLVELGRLPGFYDKGKEVQLQEKKLLFESFQEQKESMAALRRGSASSYVESAAGILEVDSAVNVRQRLMQFSQNPPTIPVSQYEGSNGNSLAARGPGLTEGIKGQIIIIEASSFPTTAGEPTGYNSASWTDGRSVKVMNSAGVRASSAEPVSARQSTNTQVTEGEGIATENPFFKLRTSVNLHSQVELDIKEAKERERELQKQRSSLYGGATEDPEEARRTRMDSKTESRVKVETGSSSKATLSPPPPPQSKLTPSGHQMDVSVRNQSTGKLDLTWPPTHADEQPGQTSEKTLKISRQRNPLLERWESGMVNGHVED
uniref:Si:ch211-207j7.2 n=1 Tax=Danio rerio TaxID=7955 RepID=A0ACD6B6X2_DANRE|nr:uncharacterized protein si:ch211-207j7.2 [Danio rerio]XP_021332665.1 uncharacterized protein si:ch211-207j7.2 [Danio rerio]|eukprot:XP_001921144.2 uncharacterized protein si:ch211-207j7.2 [Danio rerio]